MVSVSIVVTSDDVEGSTDELIEGSGSSDTVNEDFGSGIEINNGEAVLPEESSSEDEPKTISVEDLFEEEFEA